MAVGKKTRFEVFKRDSFKCQYCGRAAPEVILNADHIHPVVEGGADELLNLITSCFDCNQGKGPRLLSDDTAMVKQRQQLEELNARREQLEMMIQWKEGLQNLSDDVATAIADRWHALVPGFGLSQSGSRDLVKLLKKFSFEEVHDAMEIAATHYLRFKEEKPTLESVNLAWGKIGGICKTKRLEKEKPYIHDLYYVRAVLRNRSLHINERYLHQLLEEAEECGVDWEWLKDFSKNVRNWTEFRLEVERFITENQG